MEPELARTMHRRTPLDGGTVLSDELGLPGGLRPLVWTIVWDDGYDDAVHAVWDIEDEGEARRAALRHAAKLLGDLEGGTVASVRGNVLTHATAEGYPEADRLKFGGRRYVDVAKHATYSTEPAPWPLTPTEEAHWAKIRAEALDIRRKGLAPDFPVDLDY